MKFSSSTILAAALPAMAAGYDVACLYPPNMPDPFAARYAMHEYSGSYMMDKSIETPVVIHAASLSSICQTNCVAYHDDTMLNSITLERPIVSVPKEYHNSFSRMLCIAQCHALISDEVDRPGFFDPFFEKWGLEGIQKRNDGIGLALLSAQSGSPESLEQLLVDNDYHPFTVGQIVATEILLYATDDGWNALGDKNYDVQTGEEVPCTGSCRRYKDTYGYFPKNYPDGKPLNDTEKYVVEGKDKYWQPLSDSDGNGYFSAQEHVTPHIGFKAKTKLYDSVDDFPTCPDPQYDYYEESLKVIERLKETSSDPVKKQKIAYFDNKLLVINNIENHVKQQFAKDYSFEEEILYIDGMSNAEYEATLMAWRAKVLHDLVRPTTIIKRWGSDVLNTFGGDKSVDGPVDIAARDFEAFLRVMPHSEYPSGSSCICTGYTEFTDAFTSNYYGDNVTYITFGAAGNGTGFGCDPTQDPPLLASKGCDSDFTIPDLKTLLHECSQSRLWAGFHFEAAVVEGEKMCKGVGLMAAEHEKRIRNGSSFGSQYYQGDARPTCSNPDVQISKDGLEDTSGAMSSVAMNLVFAAFPALAYFAM